MWSIQEHVSLLFLMLVEVVKYLPEPVGIQPKSQKSVGIFSSLWKWRIKQESPENCVDILHGKSVLIGCEV